MNEKHSFESNRFAFLTFKVRINLQPKQFFCFLLISKTYRTSFILNQSEDFIVVISSCIEVDALLLRDYFVAGFHHCIVKV